MEVVNETWYKYIEVPDTFYTNATALKILDYLTKFCLRLHTIDAVDIPQLIKMLFTNANGIPQIINANGSGAAKFQAGKTRDTRRVYARCGAEVAT